MTLRQVTFLFASFLVAALGLLAMAPLAVGQETDIVVNNADMVKPLTITTALPPDLANRLAGVSPRVVVEGANYLRLVDIATALPPSLQTVLGQVAPAVTVQGANGIWHASLIYPKALFNDTTPPRISNVRVIVSPSAPTSAVVSWTTDEWATSTVLYGTQPGVYSRMVSDPLYARQHQVTLTGLTQGTRYYFRVQSTDRSDNTATSDEYSFIQIFRLYLPLIIRQ